MNDKEIDAILHDEEDDFFPIDLAIEQVENIGGDPEDVKATAMIFDDLPQLQGGDYPQEFLGMVERTYACYRMLPPINHEDITNELSELTVENIPTPTLQTINQQLQRLQAVKERVSEIIRTLIPAHTIKKRHVELLKDAWGKFATGKSADVRKGDVIFRFYQFDQDFIATESLMKTATHVAKNLDALQEILSRRVTIISLELKMHELGRYSVPDYDFTGPSLDNSGSQSSIALPEHSGGYNGDVLEADECQF